LWVFWWQLYLVGLKNNWFHRVDEVFFFFSFTQISVDEVLSGAQLRPSCPSWSPENLNPPVVYSGCQAIITFFKGGPADFSTVEKSVQQHPRSYATLDSCHL
jgi:hypothetical protein